MITINNFYDVVTNKHHNEEDWLNEIYHPDPSFDPVEEYGTEVKVLRGEFPLHKSISWDWVVPMVDSEIKDGSARILDPNFESESKYREEKIKLEDIGMVISSLDISPPEQDTWLYSVVSHSTRFYNDELKKRYIEARTKHGLKQCHVFVTYSTKTAFFGMHDDPQSLMIVAGIGDVEYSFEDGSSHLLKPGDGIYIPRKVAHKANIFGPRATFSYCWSYVK